jgi:hypothetical protein
MNDITTKIRGYNKRKPNIDKKFKFLNDLIERSVYVGKGKEPDKRFDIATEGLSLWISPQGIKTFYAFKKIKMFNKRKLKFETNNSYKKIFRFEDSNHKNLVAAKCEELKGKVQGFYVERNLTLTRELSEEDIHSQMQSMFRSREEFRASQEDLEEELFGKEKTVEEDKS